jgi:hypothetical protein
MTGISSPLLVQLEQKKKKAGERDGMAVGKWGADPCHHCSLAID